MKIFIIVLLVVAALVLLVAGYVLFMDRFGNPVVARELMEEPDGARARKVMLITLPSGRSLPVNYLREGGMVYAGADGRWWKELVGEGAPVTVLVRGETLAGHGRAIRDDPAYKKRIFAKLRPTAIPGTGTLVEIRLDPSPEQDAPTS
jgi:hypothetical protein